MTTKETQKIVGYTRRSRERENGYGLQSQADKITAWAAYKGAEIVHIYEDDDVSGTLAPSEREGLSAAMADLAAGRADALVVAKFDRLARSMSGFVRVLEAAKREGWSLICLDPDIDFGTAMGRAMANMLVTFGELEREQYIDRTQSARRAKADRGGYVGGGRKFGWRIVNDRFERDDAEQSVIDRMVEMRKLGRAYRAIADALNEDGVEAPGGPGTVWHPITVSRVLKRERP